MSRLTSKVLPLMVVVYLRVVSILIGYLLLLFMTLEATVFLYDLKVLIIVKE